jgi:hypothetical protein
MSTIIDSEKSKSVASARESLAEKMRAKSAAAAAKAVAAAEEKARKATAAAEEKARRDVERAEEKARKAVEKEAANAVRKAEREAKAAEKEAAKATETKRPRGRPRKIEPVSDDDTFLSVSCGDSDGEEKPAVAAAAAAICLAFNAPSDFEALREPSLRPTTPMRHIASLQAENAALRARLERAETALAAIRIALQ